MPESAKGPKQKRIFTSLWFIATLALWIFSGDSTIIFSAMGVLTVAATTLIFWHYRHRIKKALLNWHAKASIKFILIASICAFIVELEFFIIEKLSGAQNIAASPILALNMLITMPWYISMSALFTLVIKKYRFSMFQILLLGGIYDFFADGIFGTILSQGRIGFDTLLMLIISFPAFIATYSFILLPPTFLFYDDFQHNKPSLQKNNLKKYFTALLPIPGFLATVLVLLLLSGG